ncbi:alpha/beta hydrolase [Ornithinimicrobium sp. F0845]|uniref:alpha/beta-hydrolase family protein n=1 Tax=Ornithinimicrobium sp. F0845 TaxID=2926412 RepID=UPI001FF394F8|nr:alpha/beta-hydrolase family protein [Ornithinimicrobium sp. F0845]MCK0114143.1 alpha/beta hydrolase [Ornithinimicrobium sp. F0845]
MFPRTAPPPPRTATTLTVGAAVALSMVPSLLPRPALVQGLLTGALVLIALGILGVARRVRVQGARHDVARRVRATPESADPGRRDWTALAGSTIALALLAWLTQAHLTTQAAALGMPALPTTYWLVAGVCALAVLAGGLAVGVGGRRLARVTRLRGPGPLAAALLAGVTVTTAASAPADLLAPLRKTLDADHVMLTSSPLGASRSFVRVTEAATPEEGADLAVERMVADGGLERGAIVVALPTGSGWVNDAAVEAFEAQLGGDVAVVSAQYGDLPSWWSFLIDQEPAMRSAETLLSGVIEEVDALPEAEQPDVYLFGESLGALAGQEALAGVDPQAVCGVVWSGAPGGALSGHPRERSLHNADDPVAHLAVRTAWQRPQDWPTTWLPGLSYATTALDLPASLDPGLGHGHRYGPEQDWSLPEC